MNQPAANRFPGHATIGLQMWLQRNPLRLSPLWAFAAGVQQAGNWSSEWDFVLRLIAGIAVVDMLWGAFWRQCHQWTELPRSHLADSGTVPLPYARPQAPLSRVWRWWQGDSGAIVGRDAWLALFLALLISAWLSPIAVLATAFAAMLALISTAALPALPLLSRLLAAVYSIALPWWLAWNLFAGDTSWRWPDTPHAGSWSLLILFTLLLFTIELRNLGHRQLWQWGSGILVDITLWYFFGPGAALLTGFTLLAAFLLARRRANIWLELGTWLALLWAVGR